MSIALVEIIVILVTRFGWPGIIPILVTLFFLPFQILIGKFNGRIIQKVNVNKDKRVKTCTEIIEGIKFIKLYGDFEDSCLFYGGFYRALF